jgi:ribosomal protein L17
MLRNQASALLQHEHLTTTVAKAKELRPFVERIITVAKRGVAAGEANGRLLTARRGHARPAGSRSRDEAVRHDRAAL